jgi:hypothetical protein
MWAKKRPHEWLGGVLRVLGLAPSTHISQIKQKVLKGYGRGIIRRKNANVKSDNSKNLRLKKNDFDRYFFVNFHGEFKNRKNTSKNQFFSVFLSWRFLR